MSGSVSLLQELEDVVSRGSTAGCEKALGHVTNLLTVGSYDDEQIWVFGAIIEKLALELEAAARARLASRLATLPNAPVNCVNRLALDDSIEVAGPILRQSVRIDARTLLAAARSKGQQHLLAISQRKSLGSEVTDALIARGNREVLHSVAANPGAKVSEPGLLKLIKRTENDSVLAENVGSRRDIPRQIFQQLIAKASEKVRRKLEAERPEMLGDVQASVNKATGDMHSKFGPSSSEYFAAKRVVLSKHQYGGIREGDVFEYARSRKFNEVVAALSLLVSLPAQVIERTLTDANGETLLVLTNSLGYSWETTMALLFLGAKDHKIPAQHLERLRRDYSQLSTKTAKRVLKTYQMRKQFG